MTTHRVARKTTTKKPIWEAEACKQAIKIGASEAKVKQKVEKELIRIVAEEIAKKEIIRLWAPQAETETKNAESTFERKVKKEGAVFPGDR